MIDNNIHIKHSDLLIDYLNDSISDADRSIVEQWIETSEENKLFFEEIKNTWNNKTSFQVVDEATALANIYQKAQQTKKKIITPSSPKISWQYFSKIAAIVILAVGIGLVVYTLSDKSTDTKTLTSTNSVLKEQVLADGSKLFLNKNTSVSYPDVFDKDIRSITLNNGSIFCEIKHKTNDPIFLIETPNVKVQVVGTKFLVEKQANNNVLVYVEDGVVGFYKTDDQENQVLLQKGESALYDSKKDNISVIVNNDKNILSWHTKILTYDNEPLADVIKDLNQRYGAKIVIGDKKLNDCRLSARFENKSIKDILFYIERIFNITSKLENDNTILIFASEN